MERTALGEKILTTGGRTGRREARSTQLVFCDLSTPNPDRFNVYGKLRTQIIAGGVSGDEIAFIFIHDADTDAAKMNLFTAVNAGRVRILIGSTEKMGAGTNVQRRLRPLHHLDAPWPPRDIEQREGRILRQKNTNGEVVLWTWALDFGPRTSGGSVMSNDTGCRHS